MKRSWALVLAFMLLAWPCLAMVQPASDVTIAPVASIAAERADDAEVRELKNRVASLESELGHYRLEAQAKPLSVSQNKAN